MAVAQRTSGAHPPGQLLSAQYRLARWRGDGSGAVAGYRDDDGWAEAVAILRPLFPGPGRCDLQVLVDEGGDGLEVLIRLLDLAQLTG